MVERLKPRTPDLGVRGSSLARWLYSILSLFTQVYKLVPATHCLGGGGGGLPCDGLVSRPEGGGKAILLGMFKQTEVSSGCLGHWLVYAFTVTLPWD